MVEFIQFEELLLSLETVNVLIRVRLYSDDVLEFAKVVVVSRNAVILKLGRINKVVKKTDIVEFDLDQPHLDFLPNRPYNLNLD
jgi:hypothetical protein